MVEHQGWDWPEPLPSLLGRVKEAVVERFHELMTEYGFEGTRTGHGCVFRFIDQEGSRLTDLAARSGFTKQAIGEVVTDLEQLGYVERIPDPVDRRVKTIRLTDRGNRAQQMAGRVFAEVEREWAEQLGTERITGLRETLRDIAALPHPESGETDGKYDSGVTAP